MKLDGPLATETKIQLNHLMYEHGWIGRSLHQRVHSRLVAELTDMNTCGIIRDNKRRF